MPTTAIAALALAAFLTSAAADAGETTAGLQKPSVRILVDQHNAVPTSGTFGFGMSVFRVEAGPEIALATVDSRLRSALRSGFAREGLAYAEEAPDYLVSYALAAGDAIDEGELNRKYGDQLQLPPAAIEESADVYYQRGVLIVDLVDREARRLLWRGAILAEIDMNWPEERKQERCDAAVSQLLGFYPHPTAAK
jgi:hypothetical protein